MIRSLSAIVRVVTTSVTTRVVVLADDLFVLRRCACGHEARAHEHYRAGSDCGSCGPGACPAYRYRPFTPWRP